MTAYHLTLLNGAAVLVSCMALGLWQILSAPDRPNYPTSGPIKRMLMFWVCAALGFRGIEIIDKADGWTTGGTAIQWSGWWFTTIETPIVYHEPLYATGGQIASSLLLAALFITFLVDHCRNWLPARTWGRIQQLLALARCRPSKGLVDARASASVGFGAPPSADVVTPALIELHMQGVRVVGPNEGPEAVTER